MIFLILGDDLMRITISCLVMIGSVVASGCVTDQAHRYYANSRFPSRPFEEVEVLYEAPSWNYEVIADFQARGASVKYMQKKAAKIGADAVIVGKYGGYRAKSDEWASDNTYGRWYSRITGTAIKHER